MEGISLNEINHDLGYRAFRDTILKVCDPKKDNERQGWNHEPLNPIAGLRAHIAAYQSHLCFYGCKMLRENPELEHHVRKALGISSQFHLVPTKWDMATNIGLIFLPDRFSVYRARRLLGMVKRFEGRKYLFEHFIRPSFPGQTSQWHYSATFDHVIRHYDVTLLGDDLRRIQHLDVGLVNAGTQLGLRTVADIMKFLMPKGFGVDGGLIQILVEEEVIQAPEEMQWIAGRKRDSYQPTLGNTDFCKARLMIRLLLANGVSRRLVAAIYKYNIDYFDPAGLEATVQVLRDAGIDDVSTVFAASGELLWRSSAERWLFLTQTVGVKRAEDVSQFNQSLEAYRSVSSEMVLALRDLGADVPGLASCQSMLLAIARHEGSQPPVKEMYLLASAKHGLTVAQIAQCEKYLDSGNDLPEFLGILSAHGFGDAASVMAFQRCYSVVGTASLKRMLTIVGDRGHKVPTEEIIDWVLLAGKGGYYSSFEYLIAAIDMVDMSSLQQAVKLSPLGPALLRYLVEHQGLLTLKAIRDWYSKDAKGIQGYRARGEYGALDIIILDDAFARKSFNLLEGNQSCVADALHERIVGIIGRFPYDADEATKASYRCTQKNTLLQESETLQSALPSLLQRTGGILLGSLLKAAWSGPAELTAQLNLLSPILNDLLEGRGPTNSTLSEPEADAIALVYRTTAHTVTSTWPSLVGHEQDIAHLSLRGYYPMAWHQVHWQIAGLLDRRGLRALVSAGKYAELISSRRNDGQALLYKPLLSKRLTEPSADITTLVHHLGVLLAVAGEDSVVAEWRSKGFEDLLQVDEESFLAYQYVKNLQTLFETSLPDALDAVLDQLPRRFTKEEAALLAARLDREAARTSGADGHTQLRVALINTRTRVVAVYGKWAKRELAKFRRDREEEEKITSVSAVVTKHPAAFFAKETAKLCTRHNTEMWRESRHSHLVVFDPAGKCIVGMAMLYVEVLSRINPDVPSLVIRAINPTIEAMASYSVSSMVDAFFQVAIQIAVDNGLACVAFPTDAGMHLLSNHQTVEKDIITRFVSRSSPAHPLHRYWDTRAGGSSRHAQPVRWDVPFEAYEQGQNKVNTLYVIWQGEPLLQASELSHQYLEVS